MIKPTAMPVAILDVNGMAIIVIKAGNASSNDFQSTLAKPCIMKDPTIMSTGEVIAGIPATVLIMGVKKIDKAKSAETTSVVSPVRPPAATPETDSIYAVDGLVPNTDPTAVAIESARKAGLERSSFPSFINPPCSATPIIVPVVSNNV